MKLTTQTLKQLIKEELSEMMGNPMSNKEESPQQKQINLNMKDENGLVGYPGSPDARQRLSGYGREVGIPLDTIGNLEDFRNRLIMSNAENSDMVSKILGQVISIGVDNSY